MKFALAVLLLIYAGLVGLLYTYQRSLLYHPQNVPGDPAQSGVPEMSVNIVTTHEGLKLRNWFAPPRDASKPIGVLFYGNAAYMASRSSHARALLDLGYGVLLVSYRGYDFNPGSPSEEGLYNDARANLDWLKAQGYNSFFLMGQSLGSGVVVQMATEYEAKALVIETPYTSMVDAASYHYPWVPVRWLLKDRYDSLSKIGRIHTPVFIIQGENDEVIPVAQGRALFAAANEPKQALWLPGAHHADYYSYGGWPEVVAFLARYANGAVP